MPVKIADKEYDSIVFDLDGTFYSLTGFNRAIFFFMNFKDFALFKAHRAAIFSLRGRDFGGSESYLDSFYRAVSQKTGRNKEDVKEWYQNVFYEKFIKFLKKYCKVRDGLTEMIDTLKENGVTVGVFSDYGRVEERLSALGIDAGIFDVIFSGEKYGALKPEPRVLSLMIDFFGTDTERVLLVGDRIDTDGACAKKCGTGFYHIDGDVAWEDLLFEIKDDKDFKNKGATGV